MCIIQAYGYTINGTYPISGPCTARLSDTIIVTVYATFDNTELGKVVKGDVRQQHPPGTNLTRLYGSTKTITSTGMEFFEISVNAQITTNGTGVYIINDVGITDATSTTLCFTGQALEGCQSLTVTQECTTPTCGFSLA